MMYIQLKQTNAIDKLSNRFAIPMLIDSTQHFGLSHNDIMFKYRSIIVHLSCHRIMFTANSSGTSRQTMFNKDTLYCKYALQLHTGCCTNLASKARTTNIVACQHRYAKTTMTNTAAPILYPASQNAFFTLLYHLHTPSIVSRPILT